MIKIIPAILAHSQEEFEEKIERLKDLTQWVQVDIYPGLYWRLDLPFKVEAHVMLPNPNLEDFQKADRIIMHQGVVSFLKDKTYALVLAVEPGKSGQEFRPGTIDIIKKTRREYPEIDIAVDGGVNLANCQKIIRAGANVLVVGSFLFKSQNIEKAIQTLHDKCSADLFKESL